MSAFHPKATEQRTQFYVGFVPISDIAPRALRASDFLLRLGYDWTDRVPTLRSLQVLSGTLDGEAATCAPEGIANFDRITRIVLEKKKPRGSTGASH